MKGVKWKSIVKSAVVFMSLFVVFVTNSANTNALGVTGAIPLDWSTGYMANHNGTNHYDDVALNKSGRDLWATYANKDLKVIYMVVDRVIPANSLVSFSINWKYQTNNYSAALRYYGLQFSDGRTLLFDSCQNTNPGLISTTGITQNDFQCTYVYYNWADTNIIDTVHASHFIEPALGWLNGANEAINVVIGPPSAIQLTNNGLSADDRTWLENALQASNGDTAQVVQELQEQNNKDDQDRQDLQDTQTDADSSADASSQQAESTGSTLLQAFTSFVNALTSATPSDCNINFNVMGYINGGNVNLCQLSLPPAFQAIGTLIMIGFCVPLSIATARKIINLFRSFQS